MAAVVARQIPRPLLLVVGMAALAVVERIPQEELLLALVTPQTLRRPKVTMAAQGQAALLFAAQVAVAHLLLARMVEAVRVTVVQAQRPLFQAHL
jgi:hypothetical protein